MPRSKMIRPRGGTAAEWAAANPVLAFREIGVVTDTGLFKVGDGTSAWNDLVGYPLIFWQNSLSHVVPNATWAPMSWDTERNTEGDWHDFTAAATTIAAGSNGAALPQATINVLDTTGGGDPEQAFENAGYFTVAIGGKHVVIQYTGKTPTSFTGCSGGTGAGALATGQTVEQANVEFHMPPASVGPVIAELAWASSAAGGRGTRFRALNALGPGIHLAGATDFRAAGIASADPLIRSIAVEQPANDTSDGTNDLARIEGYQSSGGVLDSPVNELAAPRLVIQALSAF